MEAVAQTESQTFGDMRVSELSSKGALLWSDAIFWLFTQEVEQEVAVLSLSLRNVVLQWIKTGGKRPSSFIQTASAGVLRCGCYEDAHSFSLVRYHPPAGLRKSHVIRSVVWFGDALLHDLAQVGVLHGGRHTLLIIDLFVNWDTGNQFRDTTTPSHTDTISRRRTGRTCAADQAT